MPTQAVSQTFVYSASSTESHLGANFWYGTIVVTNGTAVALNVLTNGGTAVASASTGEVEVEPGQTRVFGNLQPMPNSNVSGGTAKYNSGVDGAFDQSEAPAWTAQQGFAITNGTFCSVIPQASATGNVTITFQ